MCQPAPASLSRHTVRWRAENPLELELLHKGSLCYPLIHTLVPSTISPLVHDTTLLPQGETEQGLEEMGTAAAISWTNKGNRPGRAS